MQNRFIEGGTSGTTHAAGLPNITGEFVSPVPMGWPNGAYGTGALTAVSPARRRHVGNSSNSYDNTKDIGINASLSNTIYGNSTTVQPASMEMAFCIKY